MSRVKHSCKECGQQFDSGSALGGHTLAQHRTELKQIIGEKIGNARRGKPLSKEHRKNQSESLKLWWKNRDETEIAKSSSKISKTKKGVQVPWNKGLTKETSESLRSGGEKISQKSKGVPKLRFRGEGNPNWNGGVHNEYGEHWSEIRARTLTRDSSTCQICGKKDKLRVHHLMGQTLDEESIFDDVPLKDNRDEWLVTLCLSCHSWVERKYNKTTVKDNRLLLMSGGIDSTVAFFLLDKPTIMYQCIGHRYMRAEFITVCKFAKRNNADLVLLANINLGQFEEPDANIPGRNMHLISTAAYFADTIYLVAQKGEQSIPDRSPEFFKRESDFLTDMFEKPKKVDCVFPNDTKQDLVKKYLEMGYPKDELLQTYSCFTPGGTRCGECAACFRTAIALDYNNILPDNFFKHDLWQWPGIQGYINRLKSGVYEKIREEQTISVLRKRGFDI